MSPKITLITPCRIVWQLQEAMRYHDNFSVFHVTATAVTAAATPIVEVRVRVGCGGIAGEVLLV